MKRLAIICVCAFLLESPSINGQTASKPELATSDMTVSSAVEEEEYPWEGRTFLAAGYGYVQGFRAELGWNVERYFVLGITFGIDDYWSRDPGEGTIGFILGFNIPIPGSRMFTPYLLVGHGGTVSIMGSQDDTYTFFNVGGIIPIIWGFMLRPELSLCITSRPFVDESWTTKYRTRTYTGANLVLEFAI
jgi:hypothetical protein